MVPCLNWVGSVDNFVKSGHPRMSHWFVSPFSVVVKDHNLGSAKLRPSFGGAVGITTGMAGRGGSLSNTHALSSEEWHRSLDVLGLGGVRGGNIDLPSLEGFFLQASLLHDWRQLKFEREV